MGVWLLFLLAVSFRWIGAQQSCTLTQDNCEEDQFCVRGSCSSPDGKCKLLVGDFDNADDFFEVYPFENPNLASCPQFKKNTCCGTEWNAYISWLINQARVWYDRSCYEPLEELLCAPCDPLVGTGNLTTFPCQSLCDRIFAGCNPSKWLKYDFTQSNGEPGRLWLVDEAGSPEIFSIGEFYSSAIVAPFSILAGQCAVYYDSDPTNDPSPYALQHCYTSTATQQLSNWSSIILLLLLNSVNKL
eukprot:TRINITY_DN2124_c0_g1_i1.p1 TRINITY_DN2124_c0_g1~~TRINITY_DN2124_c0_g1_i1.p1  ORF type:complete len:244 (+),score=13.62 TRINITY_DN2124_c0_g1_i1:776-1507(+)